MNVRWLVVLGLSAVTVSGCSASGGLFGQSFDEATTLAMEACGIEPVEDSSDQEYSRPSFGGQGNWNVDDPLSEIRDREDFWRDRSTAAEAASQQDSQWDGLAENMTFNLSVVSRVLQVRGSGPAPSPEVWQQVWPDFGQSVANYNANLDEIDVTCGALLRNIS